MTDTFENTYAAARHLVQRAYAPLLSGSDAALFVIVSDSALSDAARNALVKTAEARGYGPDGATFLTIDAGSEPLDAAGLFAVLEGLDPLCLVVAGCAARTLVEGAYRCELPDAARMRLFGRDACSFADLNTLMESGEGKQEAWALLRALPRFNA